MAENKIRCVHEFCCYPAVGEFQPVTGYDGITRTWGVCALHTRVSALVEKAAADRAVVEEPLAERISALVESHWSTACASPVH